MIDFLGKDLSGKVRYNELQHIKVILVKNGILTEPWNIDDSLLISSSHTSSGSCGFKAGLAGL